MKSQEQKINSSQIGIFDMMDNYDESLVLPDVWSFTIEERLGWEQEMIWFFVSGHPFDWLSRYCLRRSQNTKKLKMSFEELSLLPEYQEEEKEEVKNDETITDASKAELKKVPEKREQEIVSCVGLITDIRKIITKKWTPMIFLKCDSFDYEFEIVIFPKDVEKYEAKLELNRIVIVSWALNINLEYKRKTVQVRDLKIASITMVRDQAKELWLLDDKKRFANLQLNQDTQLENLNQTQETLKWDEDRQAINDPSNENDHDIDHKIEANKSEKNEKIRDKYIVEIPKVAKKQDLQELKEFLLMQTSGHINIYILLSGQEIFTKIAIWDIAALEQWEQNKWG